jgi:hypothetical protein
MVQPSVMKLRRAFQPICQKDRIIVGVFATFSILGSWIDRTDAVNVPLRKVELLVGAVIWLVLEKRTKADGFVLFFYLAWFL